MRLRTQILSLILGLLVGTATLFAYMLNAKLDPEMDKQVLETVSLLALRERDLLNEKLNQTVFDLQMLSRHFNLDTRRLSPLGEYQARLKSLSEPRFYRKKEGQWEWLGPGPDRDVQVRTQDGVFMRWREGGRGILQIQKDDFLSVVEISNEQLPVFKDFAGGVRGYLLHDFNRIGQAILSSEGAPAVGRSLADLFPSVLSEETSVEQVSKTNWQDEGYFAAYMPSKEYNFAIAALWPVDEVQSSWLLFRSSLWSWLAAFLGAAVLVGLALARRMSSRLEALGDAVARVGDGDFAVSFDKKGRDEIGNLMGAFQMMSGKIAQLMAAARGQERMEQELKTARLVQESFYPVEWSDYGRVKVVGRIASASECGGDIWCSWKTGDAVYVVIADATGHGVPAALLTASLRAAVSIFEKSQIDSIQEMGEMLGRVVRDGGRGRTYMTAQILRVDSHTGEAQLYNASHEPAFLLPSRITADFNWSLVDVLDAHKVARLGDDQMLSTTSVQKIQLQSGARIVLLTDGLRDVRGDLDREWKDRQILKSIGESFASHSGELKSSFDGFWKTLEERRAGAELVDDVTVVMVEWSDAANEELAARRSNLTGS